MYKKYQMKFIFIIILLMIMIVSFFNYDIIFKFFRNNEIRKHMNITDDAQITTSESIYFDIEKEKNNQNNIKFSDDNKYIIDDKNTITLDEGIRLLNNKEKNKHVDIIEEDINTHTRRVTNVKIVGYYKGIRPFELYIDEVKTKDKIYNDVIVQFDNARNIKEISPIIENLRYGDKVEVICSIFKPNKKYIDYYKRYYDNINEDFVVMSGSDDEKYEPTIILYRDEIDDKIEMYSDKEKIYDFYDIYDDMILVFEENMYRGMKIFNGIKFKVKAKFDSYFNVYDKFYYKYLIYNDGYTLSTISQLKQLNSQINFIGTDKDNNESRYFLTKDYFSFGNNRKTKQSLSKEQVEEKYLIRSYKEKKEGLRDLVLNFNIGNNFRIELSVDIINSDNYIDDDDINVDNTGTNVKSIDDNSICIGDYCSFGKNLVWRVLDIDERNENKILIMLDKADQVIDRMTWSDKDKCTYANSDVRSYLNNDFINNYFDDNDKKKILTTKIDYNVAIDPHTIETSTLYDKIFVLSDEEIDKYKLLLVNPITTSFIRDQRYSYAMASMYRRNKLIRDEHKQDMHNNDEKWSVYPLMWIQRK